MLSNQQIAEALYGEGERITPDDIDANIVSEHYFTADLGAAHGLNVPPGVGVSEHLKRLTFCVLVLRNGFTVTGESACAHPKSFNPQYGRDAARDNAVEKVWAFMGYELRTKLANAEVKAPCYKWTDVATHETLVDHLGFNIQYFVRMKDGQEFKGVVDATPSFTKNAEAILADINDQASRGEKNG